MNSRATVRLCCLVGWTVLAFGCAQSDQGITASVKTNLVSGEGVNAARIDVVTQNRVVTLTGQVATAAEKSRAVQIARNTEGVTEVIDHLAVVPKATATTGVGEPSMPPGAIPTSDTGLTVLVKAKLLADPDTSGLRIDVDTADGVVTLKGPVRTQSERSEALRIARSISGVRRVIDRLVLEPGL